MKYSELKKIADPMIARIYTDLGFKQAGKGVTKFKKKVSPYCTRSFITPLRDKGWTAIASSRLSGLSNLYPPSFLRG